MILLNAHSLTKGRRVPLASMNLNLKERDSTASMVPEDMTGISVGSWLLDDTKPGANTVWRVRSIRTAYATDTPTVELEHAIGMLRDLVLFGAIGPEKITGKDVSTCTAKQAVTYILGKSSDWTLGSFEFNNVSMPYKFEGDTLWDALQTVSDTLEDCWWSYDMTVYPFKLNIKKATTGVACELRPGRNLATLTKTVDRSGMYTRFYPIGKDDLHVSGGGYVEKNVAAYGVISKVETDQTITTQAELTRWANERLAIHATPVVTIDVEGIELSRQTGEKMDGLTLGRQCYVPLAEFGTEILETISELNYKNKIAEPEVFRATLANSRQDVTKILAEEIKRGGGGGRAAARQAKEDHSWFINTEETIGMVVSGLSDATAKIEVMDGEIDLKVDKSGVINSINVSTEGVVIKGTKISLEGTVWAQELAAVSADVDELSAGDFTGVSMKCFTMAVNSNYMTLGGSTISKQTYTIDGVDYKLLHWN